MLVGFEQVLMERRPDLVVVAGDVNSTLACALAAAKLGVPVAHLEAGLRSDDWTMPEEINRVLTDRMSDVLLTHSPEAEPNLLREGIDPARIHYVGNTMIDSLRELEGTGAPAGRLARARAERPRVRARDAAPPLERGRSGAPERDRGGAHRRSGPPRPWSSRSTRARATRLREASGLSRLERANVRCIAPAGYLDFLSLAGRRRRDRDRLGRRPGGGLGAGRALLHVPRQHRAPRDPHPRHERAARRRPGPDRRRSPLHAAAHALRDPALGRSRGGARRRTPSPRRWPTGPRVEERLALA